jgi:hypothetical protein
MTVYETETIHLSLRSETLIKAAQYKRTPPQRNADDKSKAVIISQLFSCLPNYLRNLSHLRKDFLNIFAVRQEIGQIFAQYAYISAKVATIEGIALM